MPNPKSSPSYSATDQMSKLGSLQTLGRLGGVRLFTITLWVEGDLASRLPRTGGDLGMMTGVLCGTGGGLRGSMSLMMGGGVSGAFR